MLIALLIIFIFFSTLLKLSFWRLWQIALWAGVLVAFLWGSYDFASEQSQTTLSQWLASPKILSDIAVLITIESAIGLLFAFVALRDYYQNRRSKAQRILLAFPGLLLFPCLIYVLAQAFFFFSGADFAKTTLYACLALFAFMLLGTKGIAALLPEKDLRLEVLLMVNILIILLGLTATANAQIIYVPKSEPIDFVLLGKVFLFFLSLFALGFAASKGYWYLKGKRNH
ncbi:hypothetical protein [Capnocytophaga granulosa]|uniref:hypothetical protein n=1 Tax=Capnocytophaga granulosa TaxID=45242 RepID=UPI0028E47E51|nr:hypothetical protein [Capnocytophaga granulosa]